MTGFEVGTGHGSGSGQPRSAGYSEAWTDGIFDFNTSNGALGGTLLTDGAGWWSDFALAIEDGYEGGWDLGAATSEIYGSFYYKWENNPTHTADIVLMGRTVMGTIQARIAISSGALVIKRGSTIIATGPLLSPSVWRNIEFRYLCDNTTGRFVVKVDGDTKIDYTGDTSQELAADFRYLWLASETGGDVDYFDDVIINDTSGSANTGYPDGEVVIGLRPNAAGDTNDLDPGRGDAGETTFQRVYIDHWADDVPDIAPAPDALWDRTSSMVRRNLALNQSVKVGTYNLHESRAVSAQGGDQYDDNLIVQAISPPLAAQTISGTFKAYFRTVETLASLDARSQIVIRVVSADGATVRGTLYAGDTGTGAVTQEWLASSSSSRNASFPRSVPASISSLAISAGDRLVVELGFRQHSASSYYGVLKLGILDLDAFPLDLLENETDTGDNGRGWLEFSSAITLAASSGDNFRFADHVVAAGAGALLRSSTTDEKDLYNLEATPAIVSAVSAVAVSAVVRKTQPGTRKVALPVKRAGTESAGSDLAASLSWQRVRRIMDTDPTDSSSWTTGKVDALQAGAKVR